MSDIENENGESARTDALELEAVRRVLETSARSKQKEREQFPVSAIPKELEEVRTELEKQGEGVPEAGDSAADSNKRAILTEEERDELRSLLARPNRETINADAQVRGLRDDLTARYERLATLTRANDDRSLLFALDKEGDHELLLTRLAPRFAHETQTEGRLHALVRKLERIDLPSLAIPLSVSAADDGAPLIAWELPGGASLGTEIARRGAFRPQHALAIAQNLLRVLDHAHRASLVHGALSLENVWLLESVPWTDSNPHGVGLRLLEFGFGAWNGDDVAARQADDVRDAARIFYQLLVGTPVEGDVLPSSELRGLPDRWGKLLESALTPQRANGVATTSDIATGCGDASSFLQELERLENTPQTSNERWKIAAGVFFLTTCGSLSWKLLTTPEQNTVLAGESENTATAEQVLQLEARLSSKRDELVRARSMAATSDSERDVLAVDVVELERELIDLRAGERAAAAVLERNATLAADLQTAGAEHEALAAASATALDGLRQKIADVIEERRVLESRLAAELSSAQERDQAVGLRIDALNEQLTTAQAQHAALDTELETTRTDLDSTRSSLAQANERTDQAETARTLDNDKHEAARERTSEQLSSARAALSDATDATAATREQAQARVRQAEGQTQGLAIELQTSVEQQREADRLHRAESARSRATKELLQARIRVLVDNVKDSRARMSALEAEVAEIQTEREALRERLERELERRIVQSSSSPRYSHGSAYATLVAEFAPDAQQDSGELERMRALVEATTAENAALLRALAERDATAETNALNFEQRISDLEHELAAAHADTTAVSNELVELDDLRRSRADALHQLELILSEVESERTARQAAVAKVEHYEKQLQDLEERWLEREAEHATSLIASRLAGDDTSRRNSNEAATAAELQQQVDELERSLGKALASGENDQASLKTAAVHSAAQGKEIKELALDLTEARSAPRHDREMQRRLAALEAEHESLAESLDDERRTLRRRLQADFEARLATEQKQLAQELTSERAASSKLSTEIEQLRETHAAERALLEEEAQALRDRLDERGQMLDGERQANSLLERRSNVAEVALERSSVELTETAQALESERVRARTAIGETIAARAEQDALRTELDERETTLAKLDTRFRALSDDRNARLEHSGTPALAHEIDTLLGALLRRETVAPLNSPWSDAKTTELLDALSALPHSNTAAATDSVDDVLQALTSETDALRTARLAWAGLAPETPWLWEPDVRGEPTDRTVRVEELLARTQVDLDVRRGELEHELHRTWRAWRTELDVPYAPAAQLSQHLETPLEPLAAKLAEAVRSAAGADAQIDAAALQPFTHLDAWARGFAKSNPFESTARTLNVIAFARALADGSPLGAAPSPLPIGGASAPAWWSRAIDLARNLKDPAPGFDPGLRSIWSLDGREVLVVVLKRMSSSKAARLDLQVTVDGQPERWSLADRTWTRFDRAGAVLARFDLGELHRSDDWRSPTSGAWRQFTAPAGALVPRFGPTSWGAGAEQLKLLRVKSTSLATNAAISQLDR